MNDNELNLVNLTPDVPAVTAVEPDKPAAMTEMVKPTSDTLVVVSKVKAYLSDAKMRCAGDVADALTVEIKRLLNNAVRRCQARGRGTVQGMDI